MKQHSEGVAELMKSFALADDFAEIYSYCGLLHDIGKYSKEFQNYIRSRGEKEPHAKWGAYMAMSKNVAFPIIGHHAGLPNRDMLFKTLEQCAKDENSIIKSIRLWKKMISLYQRVRIVHLTK